MDNTAGDAPSSVATVLYCWDQAGLLTKLLATAVLWGRMQDLFPRPRPRKLRWLE